VFSIVKQNVKSSLLNGSKLASTLIEQFVVNSDSSLDILIGLLSK
jgi:hypothetical protein